MIVGWNIDPIDGGGWDGIGCSRERGLGAVIEDVEATDAEMKVVMSEEFGEIQGLVFHCDVRLILCSIGSIGLYMLTCHTDCHVFFLIRRRKRREWRC